MVLSERTASTIRGRIEALRGSEEEAGLTAALRDTIVAWLDAAAAAIEQWPLDPFDFSSIAGQLAISYRSARKRIPDDWSLASAEDLHELRQRVVDLRYQMELIEPLWPRFGRMWTDEVLKRLTGPHQPLAHWRSRLTPACTERATELAQRAARIAVRLFAEKPKAFRQRLEQLWEHAR
jgi:CHAD domain-containing protein